MNVCHRSTSPPARIVGLLVLALCLSGATTNVARAGDTYGASELESSPAYAQNHFDHPGHGRGNPGRHPGRNPGGGGGGGNPSDPVQPVPEPGTMALAGMGLMAVAGMVRRRFQR